MSSPGTVAQLLDWAEARLAAAGIVCGHGTTTPRDEAAAIIYHVMELDHRDPAAYDVPVGKESFQRIDEFLQARTVRRVPLPYLLGEAWFAGLPFYVDERVLVPRSPFAELIAARFEPWLRLREDALILEIGTGSGCIAIATALAFPHATVVATDVSAGALDVARRNVRRHGVADRVQLVQADLLDGIAGRFDLVLSNPPYVPVGDLVDMPPEYAQEPHLALAGGADGLALVRRILQDAADHLHRDGWLAVEVGGGAETLERAFPQVPFLWPEFEHGGDGIALAAAADLAGVAPHSIRE